MNAPLAPGLHLLSHVPRMGTRSYADADADAEAGVGVGVGAGIGDDSREEDDEYETLALPGYDAGIFVDTEPRDGLVEEETAPSDLTESLCPLCLVRDRDDDDVRSLNELIQNYIRAPSIKDEYVICKFFNDIIFARLVLASTSPEAELVTQLGRDCLHLTPIGLRRHVACHCDGAVVLLNAFLRDFQVMRVILARKMTRRRRVPGAPLELVLPKVTTYFSLVEKTLKVINMNTHLGPTSAFASASVTGANVGTGTGVGGSGHRVKRRRLVAGYNP